MTERVPKTWIKKTDKLSPEAEYKQLNGLEMHLETMEYIFENRLEYFEEGFRLTELYSKIMEKHGYQINPESTTGILFERVNALKKAKIEEKLNELDKKVHKHIQSSLLKEEIHLNIEELNEEYGNNGEE